MALLALTAATAGAVFPAAGEAASREVWVEHLETDGVTQPLGSDARRPRLSWRLGTDGRDVRQSAFRVLVATSPRALQARTDEVWDTGKVSGPRAWTDYAGPALRSQTRYFWAVQIWDAHGKPTAWSDPTWFETGFMDPSEWRAEWITRPLGAGEKLPPTQCNEDRAPEPVLRPEDTDCAPPSPILRTEFDVARPVASARLYASGLGYAVHHLNGERVGEEELSPSFTDYSDRVFYVTHDVTDALRQGRNALGTELGRGYYAMTGGDAFVAPRFAYAPWHDEPKLRLELHVRYTDGTTDVVRTGPGWKATTGPTIYDHLLLGETYDARRAEALAGWTQPGYDDGAWSSVTTAAPPKGGVTAQDVEPSRVTERRRFETVTEIRPGVFVFDLGQNAVGWTTIRVRGNAGAEVRLVHGEKLDPDGSVPPPDNFGAQFPASQTTVYRLAGTGVETYRPRFTYYGFQYVQVTGWPEGSKPTLDDLTAEIVHTDFRRVGRFSASNSLLDRIVRNMSWAIRQNAQAMTTDTPIYEKTGWLTNLEHPSWTWLFDTQRFYSKWSNDMEDAQHPDGGMPYWAPNGWPEYEGDRWPNLDAALFNTPHDVHTYFGDARPLAARYDAMERYLAWIEGWTDDGLYRRPTAPGYPYADGLGDWARPGQGLGVRQAALGVMNPVGVGAWADAQAWWFEMTRIAAETAALLGRGEDAQRHRDKVERIRTRYNETFLDAEAAVYRDPSDPAAGFSQHINAMSLELGLVPPHLRQRVADGLADDVKARGYHHNTGSIGIAFLWPALSRHGHLDVAVKTAAQTTYPSYGYWIDKLGWTSLGEFWEEESRSRSHNFQGTIVEWFFEDLAGIEPLEPGFERIEFRPEVPTEGLDWVSASSETINGPVASRWRKAGGGLEVDITVPPNSTGLVHVPASDPRCVTESGQGKALPASEAEGVRLVGVEGHRVAYSVGSGDYEFRVGPCSGR